MEIVSRAKHIRISPRKVRLVADAIKKMQPKEALLTLKFMNKAAAEPMYKVLKSAVANAVSTYNLKENGLVIKTIEVNEGPTYKRGLPVSRGRWHEVKKRTSHITIVLEDNSGTKN